MKEELWLPVKGYEGLYEVSSLGRVRSVDAIISHLITKSYFRKGRIRNLTVSKCGYNSTHISKGGIDKTLRVCRAVAQAFIPNPENKPQVNHINGIKTDNRVENLEWCTASENVIHAYKTGLKVGKGGSSSPCAKFTDEEILQIRSTTKGKGFYTEEAKKYGIVNSAYGNIIRRKTYKNI